VTSLVETERTTEPAAKPRVAQTRDRPKVSLCVPAYQAERHVRGTVESLLAQRYLDFEIVIVDNNCSDRTPEILKDFDDSRIRVIRNESTLPLVDNFNHAVQLCRGEFVKLVCADDILHPDCIARQSAVLERHPEVALVSVQTDFVDDDGALLRPARGLRGIIGRQPADRVVRQTVRSGTNPVGAPMAVMFRRDDFLHSGGFRDELLFLSDADLWLRLLHYGDFYGIPRTLASFRFGSTTVSARMAARSQLAQHKAFVRALSAQQQWGITRLDRVLGWINRYDKQLRRTVLFEISKRRDARRHKP
jgi:glycosyltransferase involved in cell wall biosynthesis